MKKSDFIVLLQGHGHMFFSFDVVPEEIPTLPKGGEGKTGESTYHSYKTYGHIMVPAYKGGEEWWEVNPDIGERYRMYDPVSDACVVEASESEVFDPSVIVGDVWGNLWMKGEDTDVQITYVPD